MRRIVSQVDYTSTEFFTLLVDNEGIEIDFIQSIDDLIINNTQEDVLIVWDIGPHQDIDPEKCFCVPGKPDIKEIPQIKSSRILLKTKEPGKTSLVYIVGQRN